MESEGYPLRLSDVGYIQFIDPEYILTLAGEHDLVIRLLCKPGSFVRSGTVVAHIWPASRISERLHDQISRAFQLGNQRTPSLDIVYAINQLVEVAVRAMSPAINDPFTAMTCLDYMGNGLALFAQQGEKGSQMFDQEGCLRLIFEPVTFSELLNSAFDMLRHASCDNASVLLHMLDTMEEINLKVQSPEVGAELHRHISLVQAECLTGALVEQDRQVICTRGEALQAKLVVSP